MKRKAERMFLRYLMVLKTSEQRIGANYCRSDILCRILSGVVEGVKWLMAADRKVTALKELQGHIWRHGYQNGDLHGQ